MAHLSNFTERDQLYTLVAGERTDITNELMGAGARRLATDRTNRTIFIGLGGNGIKTINHIKGVIKKRLDEHWDEYIGFLGIDTDRTEFQKAKHLTPNETLVTTHPGVNNRYQNRGDYPDAALRFMPKDLNRPNKTLQMPDMFKDGANQKRLVGKAKLHDRPAGSEALDVQIVRRLEHLVVNGRMQPLGATSAFEVYVIGSTCGGTCSGAFLEMPALVRKALLSIAGDSDRLHIHAILYLPDALPGNLSSAVQANLQANGYASLKELNYYQGMEMRQGYTETWSYNGGMDITIPNSDGIPDGGEFFMIPYLIGSPSGASPEAPAQCREVIGEFLVSLLADINTTSANDPFLTQAFLANATDKSYWSNRPGDASNTAKERKGTFHDMPMGYSSIGFAKADVPQDLVRAYQVKKVAKDAGISPVKADDRKAMMDAGVPVDMLPFRAMDDWMSSTEANAAIDAMMAPLSDIHNLVYTGVFNAEADLPGIDLTFEGLKSAQTRQAMDQKRDIIVKQRTNADALEEIEKKIQEKYKLFRDLVHDCVVKHGPYAFVNLFDGNYTCLKGEMPLGIKTRLENLVNGKNANGSAAQYVSVETAQSELTSAEQVLSGKKKGIISTVVNAFNGSQDEAKDNFLNKYNQLARSQIIEVKRAAATGADGYLFKHFLERAILLRDDLKCFGDILDVLGTVYDEHGKKMEKFEDFKAANVGETSVNMAAISDKSYSWLKAEADNAVLATMGMQFRTRLVDDFFTDGNRALWLDVPNNIATKDGSGNVNMLYDGAAIPAREIFDKIAAATITTTVDVSVSQLFNELTSHGQSFDTTAKLLVDQLYDRSRPRYRGEAGQNTHKYIMYPSALKDGENNGPAIAAAIENYAQTAYGISAYTSDDADGIMFYQQVVGLDLNKLTDISVWEQAYERKLTESGNLLHGTSPDTASIGDGTTVDYVETISWADYPSLVGRPDPERPDPKTSKICREGQRRIELRELMEEAIKLGVIYSEKQNDGWHFYRVFCDRVTPVWSLDVQNDLTADENGLLPLGRELLECVAKKHNRALTIDENGIVKEITLANAGHLSKHYQDEKVAFEYALRCLRANVPMHVEVIQTVRLFREWAKEINKLNEKVLEQQRQEREKIAQRQREEEAQAKLRLRPAKMVWLMRGGVLFRDDHNIWMLKDEYGYDNVVLDLSEDAMMFDWSIAQILENKLIGYTLYQKVDELLPEEKLDAACRRANEQLMLMQQSKDMDALRVGMALYQELDAERKAILALGANPNADEKSVMLAKFRKEMSERMAYSDKEAKAVELFYSRLALAPTLNPKHFQN